jgi:hypothetical protein
VIVLLTSEDGAVSSGTNDEERRSRQHVIFEPEFFEPELFEPGFFEPGFYEPGFYEPGFFEPGFVYAALE